ncbi:DNA polymerase III subunit psi [Colwellia sp. UCD-KL20]|uniref:DNA polymerase III subunit psi n=1 Tax=Colwellia sp. UCD-KL20 TaxID=1917165 RepID=UPI000970672B|nr:DNA polymerase III subunit psi [Colwellia sp. UCD-KL20]
MTITKRQFNHLNEMGIKVWQQRNSSEEQLAGNPNTSQALSPFIDPKLLTQHLLFTDILQSINVSIGEITIKNNVIDLGLFNWQFIETESITFANSTLSTPVITAFENSVKLKKELWKTLQQKVLN